MSVFTLAVQGGPQLLLPNPGRGMSVTTDKVGGIRTTAAGYRVMQTVAVKRMWTLPYPWITDAQYADLIKWCDGTRGLGPFELREQGGTAVLVNVLSLERQVQVLGHVTTVLTLQEV